MRLHPPEYLFSGTGKIVQIQINVPLKYTALQVGLINLLWPSETIVPWSSMV